MLEKMKEIIADQLSVRQASLHRIYDLLTLVSSFY